MAEAGPSRDTIENVRIVHAEDDLEDVVRKLAEGLEHHLKLPGQADYDRQKPHNPEHINKQLEIAVNMGNPTLFYITDNVLLLFKKKKKQTTDLKNFLREDGRREPSRIAILWGSTKPKLEKEVFGDLKGHLKSKKIMLEDFSLSELGNVVEAAYKTWQGPDAVLPSKASFADMKESLARDSAIEESAPPRDGAMDETPAVPLPTPELTMVYYDLPSVKFISDLSFSLMAYLTLSTNPQFYSFFKKADTSDVFKQILDQLRGAAAGRYKAVIVLSADLTKLIGGMDAQEFERLCDSAANRSPPSIVFLLHNTTLEDVRYQLPRLAEIMKHKHHTHEGGEDIGNTAYHLGRLLQAGKRLEAEENDESSVWRAMQMEYNHHKDQMISVRGEADNIPRIRSSKAKVVSASGESIPQLGQSQSDRLTGSDYPSTPNEAAKDYASRKAQSGVTNEAAKDYASRNAQSGATNGCQAQNSGGVTSPAEGKKKTHLDFSLLFQQSSEQNSQPPSAPAPLCEGGGASNAGESDTLDERDKAYSLVSKSSSTDGSSLVRDGSQREGTEQSGGPLQSREGPSTGPTRQDLTAHPPSGAVGFSQSPGPSQHVSSGQPMGMSYIPSQPNGAVKSKPAAHASQSATRRSDPMQYFKSHPEAEYHLKQLLSQQSAAGHGATSGPRTPSEARPNAQSVVYHGLPQHPHSANPSQVFPPQPLFQGAQGHPQQGPLTAAHVIGYPVSPYSQQQVAQVYPHQQPLTVATVVDYPASAYSHQQGHGPGSQHLQYGSTGMPPMQPASARVSTPGAVGQPLLVHSRSVPAGVGNPSSNLFVQAGQGPALLSLPADVKHRIEQKLNIKKVAGMYWRHFAEEIGVSGDEIGVWDSQNSCNYMEKLFGWIGTNKEGYTVYEFRSVAERFKRPDVVRILDKWMETQHQLSYPSRT